MSGEWYKLMCNSRQLQLLGTLNGGQSFRWKKVLEDEIENWIGVFSNAVWILQQHNDHILYKVHESASLESSAKRQKFSEEHYNKLLKGYFQLELNLDEHFSNWSEADSNFKIASEQFYGIRILKQDPVENIFSFICSSNNNISRITSMVEKLAVFYGSNICEISGETYYSFPTVDALAADGVENKLRENGFGYRAKYISKSAKIISQNGSIEWINELKTLDYKEAKNKLISLTGIGAKVADCICLMSLGHLEAIPVDTHVYQIAARDYMPKLKKQKTVTETIYNEIGDHFRKLYGPLAGWAHTVLFCADLKKFQTDKENARSNRKSSK